MTFSTPIHTNEQSFDRVLATGLPLVLIWQRPKAPATAQLDKELARLAIVFEGQALFAKINSDENASLAQEHHVAAVPTLVFWRNGQEVARTTGAIGGPDLQLAVEALVRGDELAMLPKGPSEPLTTPTAPEAGGAPLTLTDATFDAALKGDKPVLVDFWAAWCGPCRMIAPSIDALAKEFAGRAVVAKVNVDENPATAQRYNIRGIPALLIFKGGRVVDQISGAQPLSTLRSRLAAHAG